LILYFLLATFDKVKYLTPLIMKQIYFAFFLFSIVSSFGQDNDLMKPTIIEIIIKPDIVSYPNPIKTDGKIEFYTPKTEKVRISLIDILGNTVRIITDENFTKGKHTLYWETKDQKNRNLKNGIYILKMKVKNNQKSIKILVQ